MADDKLSDLSREELIDMLAETRQRLNGAKKEEAILKEVLKAKLTDEEQELGAEISGIHYEMEAIPQSQMRFDGDAAKEEYGEEWWEDHCKQIDFLQMRITKKKEEE